MDFIDLNKAYPKYSYPLPNIDNLVDVASGYIILSFCDAFSRYNQILMWEEDRLKTSFIIDDEVFYYKLMPFNLKNARVTHQRIMNKVSNKQIRRNLKVYINHMLIKSKSLDDHLVDLGEKFSIIKHNKVRINPTKCIFGVVVGKFLGFMLTKREVEVNLAKYKAILEIWSPTTVK